MKKTSFLSISLSLFINLAAADGDTVSLSTDSLGINLDSLIRSYAQEMDSIESSLHYKQGKIILGDGIATINVPDGYRFLESEEAERVLVDVWGNPKDDTPPLGLLVRAEHGVTSPDSWAYTVEYDPMGYVKDDDADDINYDDLLKELKQDAQEANKQRVQMGYDPIEMIGWASPPYYDKDRRILHWAKEVRFGEEEENTLNYNVRILGRKGVLVVNAISGMSLIDSVKADIPSLFSMIEFTPGNTYLDFDPDVDQVAAWTIGGLVAGKLLAKVGFFAIILKYLKFIAIAVAGAFSFIWKRIRGQKDEPAKES
ncbi:MAG: DUF2167 domain-containing protein [Flavobacteriales bacterium]|nr:DUF2167 domain-containing protein [Flavobacteriales bacterium]